MRHAKSLSKLPIALTLAAALWGCASRPIEHFYTVSSESSAPSAHVPAQRIIVSPIVIPSLIDRPQLVLRTDGHEIAVLENHRWAQPLSVDLARALTDDLRRLRPAFAITSADAQGRVGSGLILDVVITELVTGPGASTSFEASWVLRDRARKNVDEGRLEAAIPTQPGYGAVPTAYADAMRSLADAIARMIPESGF